MPTLDLSDFRQVGKTQVIDVLASSSHGFSAQSHVQQEPISLVGHLRSSERELKCFLEASE